MEHDASVDDKNSYFLISKLLVGSFTILMQWA